MPLQLTDPQRDAFADCIAMLIDLAHKHRQRQTATINDDSQEGDASPAVAAGKMVQRANSEASYGTKK